MLRPIGEKMRKGGSRTCRILSPASNLLFRKERPGVDGDPVRNRTGISGLGNLSSIRLSYGVIFRINNLRRCHQETLQTASFSFAIGVLRATNRLPPTKPPRLDGTRHQRRYV